MMQAAMRELASRLHAEAVVATEAALSRWEEALDLVDETSRQMESEVQTSPQWDQAALAEARRQLHETDYVAALDLAGTAAANAKVALETCQVAGQERLADMRAREAQLDREVQNRTGAIAAAERAMGEAEASVAKDRQAAELALSKAREQASSAPERAALPGEPHPKDSFMWRVAWVAGICLPLSGGLVFLLWREGAYFVLKAVGIAFAFVLVVEEAYSWYRRTEYRWYQRRAAAEEQLAVTAYERELARIQADLDGRLHPLLATLEEARAREHEAMSDVAETREEQHRLQSFLSTVDTGD